MGVPGVDRRGLNLDIERGGSTIEYRDEDLYIRKMFQIGWIVPFIVSELGLKSSNRHTVPCTNAADSLPSSRIAMTIR
jgi:hypothetical protein